MGGFARERERIITTKWLLNEKLVMRNGMVKKSLHYWFRFLQRKRSRSPRRPWQLFWLYHVWCGWQYSPDGLSSGTQVQPSSFRLWLAAERRLRGRQWGASWVLASFNFTFTSNVISRDDVKSRWIIKMNLTSLSQFSKLYLIEIISLRIAVAYTLLSFLGTSL